jgi:hypothetical protein
MLSAEPVYLPSTFSHAEARDVQMRVRAGGSTLGGAAHRAPSTFFPR